MRASGNDVGLHYEKFLDKLLQYPCSNFQTFIFFLTLYGPYSLKVSLWWKMLWVLTRNASELAFFEARSFVLEICHALAR